MSVVAEQLPPEVTQTNAEAPVPAKPDEMSQKFASLARKERALRAQSQAIKAKEDAFKAQEAEYSSKYIPKDRLAKDTMAVLAEMGISQQQLTDMILNGPQIVDPTMAKLMATVEDLQKKLETSTKTQEENQTKAYDQAVGQIRNEAKLLVDSDPAYETIKGTDSVEAVVELIKETYRSDGIIMSVPDAAKQVEDYLVEEYSKAASIGKIKAKLTPQENADQKQEIPQKPQLKTLTNAVNATSKPLSDRDRRERAIAAFKGQLK